MAVSVGSIEYGVGRLLVDGQEHLCVRVSGHRKSPAGILQEIRRDRGWIVRSGHVAPWEVEGFVEHEGAIFAYGPSSPGRALAGVLAAAEDAAWRSLFALATDAAALVATGVSLAPPQLSGVLALDEGGHLFLPASILAASRTAAPEADRIADAESWNHPDLNGERAFCYFIGALAYAALTHRPPHSGKSEEEVHERAREQEPISPRIKNPSIAPEVADTVLRALSPHASFTLGEWVTTLEKWAAAGVHREVTPEERKRLGEQAERILRRSEVTFQRKSFLQRNWPTIAIVAGVVVVVGLVGGSILKNALKPRITVGMRPAQVVSLYYDSMNTLNSQAMQDCVIDGAGNQAINQVETLYVINRVREGYGQGTFIPAAAWVAKGRPPLKSGESVFGVSGLSLSAAGTDSYLARYTQWESIPPKGVGEGAGPVPPFTVRGVERVDRVFLKHQGDFWAIYRIETVEARPLDSTN